jgi:SAM-dependent methyltransferase
MTAAAPAAEPLPVLCPEDRTVLRAQSPTALHCSTCDRQYPVERGVVRLVESADPFYEGTYQNHTAYLPRSEAPWHVWPLWLINSGYLWAVRRHVPPGQRVVELGCAGGVSYFGQRYRMIGCDVSAGSLEALARVYSMLLQVDALCGLPLPDQSVDAVVSSYFWEHVPPERKLALARECARVLRPGGKLVFLYDVETDNPLIAHYRRRDPATYRRLFLEGDGHVGYQTPDDNRTIFEAAGLSVLAHRGLEKTPLQPASVYDKLAAFGGRLAPLFARGRALGQSPSFYPYTAILRALDTAVAPHLPERWARIALIVCERRTPR